MKTKMVRYGYMCWNDFDVEFGEETPDAKRVYSTLEELQSKEFCVRECGWVKVEMTIAEHGGHQTAAEIVNAIELSRTY